MLEANNSPGLHWQRERTPDIFFLGFSPWFAGGRRGEWEEKEHARYADMLGIDIQFSCASSEGRENKCRARQPLSNLSRFEWVVFINMSAASRFLVLSSYTPIAGERTF